MGVIQSCKSAHGCHPGSAGLVGACGSFHPGVWQVAAPAAVADQGVQVSARDGQPLLQVSRQQIPDEVGGGHLPCLYR